MVRTMRIMLGLGILALGAMLLACSSDSDSEPQSTATMAPTAEASATGAGGGEMAETTVDVTLQDFTITPSTDSVSEGSVTFDASNKGDTPHELVVIKTDLAADQLPLDGAKVDEDQVDAVGEIEEFPAGETQSATFDLKPGSYVLICNVSGHYQLGMHTAFTVE